MSVVEDPTEAGSNSGGGGGNIVNSSILMILGFSVICGFWPFKGIGQSVSCLGW